MTIVSLSCVMSLHSWVAYLGIGVGFLRGVGTHASVLCMGALSPQANDVGGGELLILAWTVS